MPLSFLEGLIRIAEFLWPFKVIDQWQKGCYYVFGRYVGTVNPGCWLYIPFFMDVKEVNIKPDVRATTRQDITLRDGSVLSFSINATLTVEDPALALNEVQDYAENSVDVVMGVVADRLADEPAERIGPENREKWQRLTVRLLSEINDETLKWGIRVTTLRFTNFVRAKTYRLLTDK